MNSLSGVLRFTKKEEAEMRCALFHASIDWNYGGGGSYSKGDHENSDDIKEMAKAKKGIQHLKWILDTYKK